MNGPKSVLATGAMMLFLGACGDDEGGGTTSTTTTATGGQGGGGSGGETGGGGAGGETGGGGAGGETGGGGAGGAPIAEMSVIEAFDAAAFELPEGLALDGGDVLVGFALTGAVDRIALDGSSHEPFGSLPPPPPNTSFMTGLTIGADGAVYAALVSFTADAQAGIYRIEPTGGAGALFASDPSMPFPNGFAWDDGGRLFVTDSATSTVFVVDEDGTVTSWVSDPLLAGGPEACDFESDIAVGANGIVWTPDAVFVASSDQGVLARIPIEADGSAGAVDALITDCDLLAGIDGLTLDEDGSLVGAVNRSNRIVRIDASGDVSLIAEGAPLDFPASLEFDPGAASPTLVVTSFALGNFLAGQPASPALVRVELAPSDAR